MAYQITVEYKIVDGCHVFKSKDLPGFLVASKDMESAFADVAPVMERLLKDNLGIECKVQPLHPITRYSDVDRGQQTFYDSSEPLSYAAFAAAA